MTKIILLKKVGSKFMLKKTRMSVCRQVVGSKARPLRQ